MKKQKSEKAATKAADTKKTGPKAPKQAQSFQKGAAKNFKR